MTDTTSKAYDQRLATASRDFADALTLTGSKVETVDGIQIAVDGVVIDPMAWIAASIAWARGDDPHDTLISVLQ